MYLCVPALSVMTTVLRTCSHQAGFHCIVKLVLKINGIKFVCLISYISQ